MSAPAAPLLRCRSCGGLLGLVLDLGFHPLAGAFPLPSEGDGRLAPLRLARCPACGLVQLGDPSPDESDVAPPGGAVVNVSRTLADHARGMVAEAVARGYVEAGSRVVTTASHGNHLARFFEEVGIDAVIAEEGSEAVAALVATGSRAVEGGPLHPAAVGRALGRPADLVADHFLLAHLADPVAAIAGYRSLLRDGGVLLMEFDHWLPTFAGRQWDAIRHGHISYLTLGWLGQTLARAGLVVEDAVPQDVYGGSLRVVARAVPGTGSVAGGAAVLTAEEAAALGDAAAIGAFGEDVRACVAGARAFLRAEAVAGRRVAVYGAPARGNTFLNAIGAEARTIAFAVDASAAKQGRVLPGSRIPIRPPAALREDPVDSVLVLVWDLADEIAASLVDVRAAGARLFVAVPALRELAPTTGGSAA